MGDIPSLALLIGIFVVISMSAFITSLWRDNTIFAALRVILNLIVVVLLVAVDGAEAMALVYTFITVLSIITLASFGSTNQ